MAEYYTIGGSLMHYRTKGSRNGVSNTPGYKAIGQRAVGRLVNGRYQYDLFKAFGPVDPYARYGRRKRTPPVPLGRPSMLTTGALYRSAGPTDPARRYGSPRLPTSTVGAKDSSRRKTRNSVSDNPYTKYKNEVELSRRTSGNTSSVAKAAYRVAYATGNGRYGRNALSVDQQAQSAMGRVNASGVKLSETASQTVSSVKSSMKSIKDWATKQIDWAGQQASRALSSVRTFVSNLLQKIGAGTKAIQKWAIGTYNQAKNTVANSSLYRDARYRLTGQQYDSSIGPNSRKKRGAGVVRRSTATSR